MVERPLTLDEVVRILANGLLNDIELDDAIARRMTAFYPTFGDCSGKPFQVGKRLQCEGKLYRALITIPVITSHTYPPYHPEMFYEIGEHAGTKEDPIPFQQGMVLYRNKYYTDNDILWWCYWDSLNPVFEPLSNVEYKYVIKSTGEEDIEVELL